MITQRTTRKAGSVDVFLPCPLPTLLSWATYSEIFLIASIYNGESLKHWEDICAYTRTKHDQSQPGYYLLSQKFAFDKLGHLHVVILFSHLKENAGNKHIYKTSKLKQHEKQLFYAIKLYLVQVE